MIWLNKRNYLLLLGLISRSLFALPGDIQQPIHIHSEQQSLDLKTNQVTFRGNVVIKQGSIQIHADKVVVTRSNQQRGQETIQAYGKPASFYQLLEIDKPVRGYGQKLDYDVEKAFVVLQDQARLKQQESQIQGDRITYDILRQQVNAYSAKGNKVTVVLHPDQLNYPSKKEKK